MTLVETCQHHLSQAERLTSCLDPATFSLPHTLCFGSSVGQHLRHCIDHVDRFLDGLATRQVDYDLRVRGGIDELDPEAYAKRIKSTTRRLTRAFADGLPESTPLRVKLDCGQEGNPWRESTVGRELQFLVSHTVHHFAIVSIMCQGPGIDLEPDFGVAPSTLKHRATA